MKIALFGYGRMGKEIEKVAFERQHQIVLKVSSKTKEYSLENVDLAIDFSLPNVAFDNIKKCIENGVPVISGTTGWLDKYGDIVKICKTNNGTFLYASNFSIGVNIFFDLNEKLAQIMKNYEEYLPVIEEIHHKEKIDAPSGTAISLAQPILENFNKNKWVLGVTNNPKELPIIAKREEAVPGTHIIKYISTIDEIEIKHTAKGRKGFALGAVIAAEFIVNKKGIFTMKDVLGL
ncbi:MAG TPA: 4-hydroxy-tetrahydrodipicolinate reductase [Flavobacteriia bacterium]|nr:4-hydroxy-tetrahydrodipicolinate reductase [Flavobacteriia bacterium]